MKAKFVWLMVVVVTVGSTSLLGQGFNWTQTSAPDAGWRGLASSADGNKLVAVDIGRAVFTSTNSGANWTLQTNAPNLGVVASSADGVKLAAGGGNLVVFILRPIQEILGRSKLILRMLLPSLHQQME